MFPFVWRAYDSRSEMSSHSMVGKKGTAIDRLDPSGYVRIGNELWKARLEEKQPPVDKGGEVIVTAINNLKLTVIKP